MALLKRWVRELGDRPANAFTRTDILAFKNEFLKGRTDRRTQINQLVGALHHMFKWARGRQLVDGNPAIDIDKERERAARDRALDHDEINRLWSACDQIGWPAGPIFQLLLLTGQRETEIGHLEWMRSRTRRGPSTCPVPVPRMAERTRSI
jgi:integrase